MVEMLSRGIVELQELIFNVNQVLNFLRESL